LIAADARNSPEMDAARRTLIDYFLSGSKRPKDLRIGIEIEKIPVCGKERKRLPYDGGGHSVSSILRAYQELRGGTPVREGGRVLAVEGPWGRLSMEPGGQIEWSSPPCGTLSALNRETAEHAAALDSITRDSGTCWFDVAVDPEHSIDEVCWMPAARHRILRDYMAGRGRLAHRTMAQTASIHCAIDYTDGADWTNKFRAIAIATPVAIALFANSRLAERRDTGYCSFRHALWRETDPDRCLLPPVVFEPHFGPELWADWVCRLSRIFCRQRDSLVPGDNQPFFGAFRDETPTKSDLELHISTVLTYIRSYTYLEIRSVDLPPDSLIPAVPAFWCGLLYDPDTLSELLAMYSRTLRFDSWVSAVDSAARAGLDGACGMGPFRSLAERLLRMSAAGLRRAYCADSPEAADTLAEIADRIGPARGYLTQLQK
jgi:glutamate--cysteine ligase